MKCTRPIQSLERFGDFDSVKLVGFKKIYVLTLQQTTSEWHNNKLSLTCPFWNLLCPLVCWANALISWNFEFLFSCRRSDTFRAKVTSRSTYQLTPNPGGRDCCTSHRSAAFRQMLDLKKKETLRISYDALIIENKREIMYQDILFI